MSGLALYVGTILLGGVFLLSYMLATRWLSKSVEAELNGAERLTNVVLDSLGAALWSIAPDLSRTTYLSPNVSSRIGCEAAEALKADPRAFFRLIPKHDQPATYAALAQVLGDGAASFTHRVVDASGATRWVTHCLHLRRGPAGEPSRIDGLAVDVTSTKETQDQVDLLISALNATAEAVVITGRDGVIQWTNQAFETLTGYPRSEVQGKTPRLLNSGHHDQAAYSRLWETILAGKPWHGELVNRRKNGRLYIEQQSITPVIDGQGEISHFIAIKRDITARRLERQRVQFLATHDALTRLPNRSVFDRVLAETLAEAERGVTGSLLLIDVDQFKSINDALGHVAGDEVLVAVAHTLRQCLRHSDKLFRWGGDEYAVILRNATPKAATEVASRLLAAVSELRFDAEGRQVGLGISIGGTTIRPGCDAKQLVQAADAALYASKAGGRNRVTVCESGDASALGERAADLDISDIRIALGGNRFELHFQPVVELKTQKIAHVEALLRFRDDQGVLRGPRQFIPVAEDFGLMPQVDLWVLRTTLNLLRAHPKLRVYINISAQTVGDEALLRTVKEAQPAGLTHRLGFEITETIAVRDLAVARQWMNQLRALGCHFAIDDFSSGHFSLNHVRGLPVDTVKLDGNLIQHFAQDANESADIVKGAIMVIHGLGKQVIAEWVEDEHTARALLDAGVSLAQGYLWGVPSPQLPPSMVGHIDKVGVKPSTQAV